MCMNRGITESLRIYTYSKLQMALAKRSPKSTYSIRPRSTCVVSWSKATELDLPFDAMSCGVMRDGGQKGMLRGSQY